MAGINKVILVGNLGKDPDVTTLESGVKKANFSLATTEVYKNREGERVENTEWHNIVLWRGLAEVAEKYLKKGQPIYLEGAIKRRSWDDEHGNKRYAFDIVGDKMIMLGGKRDDNAGYTESKNAAEPPEITSDDTVNDDLPF